MSYQVLARKWRPKNFSELVGQTHVMQALSNALDQQRLHHAYLFTGTRGVGKTTIARIFSKALNCEHGVSSQPCGQCAACRSIDEGRFIDLIEVDAASKTKVDDTREILDNVQFAPTQGRYKVYLIDEVHMLSKSSFNALLKTLEEPPEHVKFLLATTDPHKLPITVLSRCLQFNLMRLTQTQIQSHLQMILQQEQLPFEAAALGLIAHSADGSARDALSLLDQAIAYGGGQVEFDAVQTMLGLVDQQHSLELVQALAEQNIEGLKSQIQHLALMGVDYSALLAQLIELLHGLASIQLFGDLPVEGAFPVDALQELAKDMHPERVQVLYQIALLAKQDMLLAPDVRIGFEMAMIRMLAFRPLEVSESPTKPQIVKPNAAPEKTAPLITQPEPQVHPEVQLGEMSIEEAMAGLASARSLVGKQIKKPELQLEEASQPLENQEIESASQDAMVPPEEQMFAQSHASAEMQVEPEVPAEVDHLAEVRARLQALGKPEAGSKDSDPISTANVIPTQPRDRASTIPSDSVALQAASEYVNDQYLSMSEPEVEVPDMAPTAWNSDNFEAVRQEERFAIPMDHFGAGMQQPETITYETSTEEVVAPDRFINATENEQVLQWMELIAQLQLKGMAAEVAMNSVLVFYDQNRLELSLDPAEDFSRQGGAFQQIESAVAELFGPSFKLSWVQAAAHFTPRAYQQQQRELRMQQARDSILQDPKVLDLRAKFGWQLLEETIAPLENVPE
ncbi:DNA polymerase III subunit gamma/tau [Thiomicrorhabdus heinhorstiae]|uniref:DNA polymerase III subunit gamma/tau n=1 Tax=Thiomicrorhabdus heinhorstiae TaxID=2748010 RepID=A0ABS0C071_9GAMM|nr:DNA polymerase III subunit gamma/tau [Thiomicrorhabdus heinhorstiae]MBF6058649.1 DNA polymerase III subunit gamma/tau [Thiomicrorhabdus heinhorstiae]